MSNYHKLQDVVEHIAAARIIVADLHFEDSDTSKFLWGCVSAAFDFCYKILRQLEEGKIT